MRSVLFSVNKAIRGSHRNSEYKNTLEETLITDAMYPFIWNALPIVSRWRQIVSVSLRTPSLLLADEVFLVGFFET